MLFDRSSVLVNWLRSLNVTQGQSLRSWLGQYDCSKWDFRVIINNSSTIVPSVAESFFWSVLAIDLKDLDHSIFDWYRWIDLGTTYVGHLGKFGSGLWRAKAHISFTYMRARGTLRRFLRQRHWLPPTEVMEKTRFQLIKGNPLYKRTSRRGGDRWSQRNGFWLRDGCRENYRKPQSHRDKKRCLIFRYCKTN